MFKIINGNMLEELDKLEENSIGSIVTDPPYEINFMNNGWDNAGVAFSAETWKKCLRVLKPGGYLLSFAASRTQHRIACAIEDAGFEIRDTIMWLYGSGFPKSMDISKQLDKRNGKQNEDFTKFGNYVKQCREAKGYSKNDIDKIIGTNTACAWWEGRIFKNDFIVQLPNKENYYKLKEILDMNNDFDYLIEWHGAEREVIGKMKNPASSIYSMGKNKMNRDVDITIPSTDLAKRWQGFGTALKPAYEPIIVARKPLCGTVADNVMTYGVGGINIDECRVPTDEIIRIYGDSSAQETHQTEGQKLGRFPSNVILTYDESNYADVCGGFPERGSENCDCSDSASRYFYCAKASKRDRDEGLDDLPTKQTVGGGGGIGDYADDVNSCSGKFGSEKAPHKNFHPTVKPTSLMQYLVRLVTPKGETVLDPFMGSGSTGKAVAYENNDRNADYSFIGIELNLEYCDIAQRRIEFAEKDKTHITESKQKKSKPDETVKKQSKLF